MVRLAHPLKASSWPFSTEVRWPFPTWEGQVARSLRSTIAWPHSATARTYRLPRQSPLTLPAYGVLGVSLEVILQRFSRLIVPAKRQSFQP